MINRELYLKQLRPLINQPFIKILKGIRRSGKSTILNLLTTELSSDCNIIVINMESFEFDFIDSAKSLYEYVKSEIIKDKNNYLLIDEVQTIDGWEKAVNSIFSESLADIYITGSNSTLLSTELATLLSGRYVEIPVFTLSFTEYIEFTQKDSSVETLWDFIKFGGFPAISLAEYDKELTYKIIKDIYSTIILRDTVQRNNIRNIDLLDRIVSFLLDNVGNVFSAKSISDFFKSENRSFDIETIYNYINALENAMIIQRISRYDIRGKRKLKVHEKYYIADHSFVHALQGYSMDRIPGILENIVCFELLRRGYDVYIGKETDKEVDFVAIKRDEKMYIQVTYMLTETSTIEREFSVLEQIEDQFPKYVISMDEKFQENRNGIKHMHLLDFLQSNF